MRGHRITEWWKLKQTSKGHVAQTSWSSRLIWNRLLKTMSWKLLNISKDRDSTLLRGTFASDQSPPQWKSLFWYPSQVFSASTGVRCLLFGCWAHLKRAWLNPPWTLSQVLVYTAERTPRFSRLNHACSLSHS